MSQYGLVQPPAPVDPMQSLSALMTMGHTLQQMQQIKAEAPFRTADLASQTAERNSTTADRNAQTAARVQTATDQGTIDSIMQSGGDQDTVIQGLRDSGNGHLVPQVQKTFDEARDRKATYDKLVADTNKANADSEESQQKIKTAHADYLGGIAASVASHGYAPGAFYQGVALAHKDGMIDPVSAGRAIATAMQNPDQIKPMVDAGIAASPEQRKLAVEAAKEAEAKANIDADNRRADARDAEIRRHDLANEGRLGAGGGISQAQRDAALRLKATELDKIEKAFGQSVVDGRFKEQNQAIPQEMIDDLADKKLNVENNYRSQLGLEPLSELPQEWTPRSRTTTSAPSSAPARTGGAGPLGAGGTPAARKVGDVVQTKHGPLRITKVYPNGTYDGESAP